jgi:hypothetical protein
MEYQKLYTIGRLRLELNKKKMVKSMLIQYILLLCTGLLIYIFYNYSTIRYRLMVERTDFISFIKKNEDKLILILNKLRLKINDLLNLLNNNELQEFIYSNRFTIRFVPLLNIILKLTYRFIGYILDIIKKK